MLRSTDRRLPSSGPVAMPPCWCAIPLSAARLQPRAAHSDRETPLSPWLFRLFPRYAASNRRALSTAIGASATRPLKLRSKISRENSHFRMLEFWSGKRAVVRFPLRSTHPRSSLALLLHYQRLYAETAFAGCVLRTMLDNKLQTEKP